MYVEEYNPILEKQRNRKLRNTHKLKLSELRRKFDWG